jgi:hypothetical protein
MNATDTKDVVRFCQRSGILQGRSISTPEFETVQEVYSITRILQSNEDKSSLYTRQKRMLSILAQEDEVLVLLMDPRAEVSGYV